ncbi:MAG: NADPH-dependent F420 reductase [Dehalococcoidia bacterium]|nr:NADPH-dependent F420 reductase [Dehalococcoidia bacterium]
MTTQRFTLGFLGGTGPEGKGLGLRLALAGHEVLLGSRDFARAQEAALELAQHVPPQRVRAALNAQVAVDSQVVFITVPYPAQRSLLEDLREPLVGKVVVSTSIPLAFSQGKVRSLPVEEGCAALQAQALLPRSRVVGAFQNVSAVDLLAPDRVIDCDIVVCADDAEAKRLVMGLAEEIKGIRAVDGGALENSGYVEQLTALLLNINRIYRGSRTMVKIVGIRGLDTPTAS